MPSNCPCAVVPQDQTRDLTVAYATVEELRSMLPPGEEDGLNAGEREELEHWRDAGRREAWWFGRVLCKQLIADAVGDPAFDPATVEIRSRDAAGRGVRPVVCIDGDPQPWSLSISHTERGVLAALCVRPGMSIGADLAAVESFRRSGACNRGLLKTWFTPCEQNWLAGATSEQLAIVWSAKEAVYKACNRGEPFAPRRIEIRRRGPEQYGCTVHGTDFGDWCEIKTGLIDDQAAAVATLHRLLSAGEPFDVHP